MHPNPATAGHPPLAASLSCPLPPARPQGQSMMLQGPPGQFGLHTAGLPTGHRAKNKNKLFDRNIFL
eukprot:12096528-Alexandrium_andersonii.AAC.1